MNEIKKDEPVIFQVKLSLDKLNELNKGEFINDNYGLDIARTKLAIMLMSLGFNYVHVMSATKVKLSERQETTANKQHDNKVSHISNISDSFYSLIDKLEEHAKLKNPKLKCWSLETYYDIAFNWIGKEEELKKKVESFDFGNKD